MWSRTILVIHAPPHPNPLAAGEGTREGNIRDRLDGALASAEQDAEAPHAEQHVLPGWGGGGHVTAVNDRRRGHHGAVAAAAATATGAAVAGRSPGATGT